MARTREVGGERAAMRLYMRARERDSKNEPGSQGGRLWWSIPIAPIGVIETTARSVAANSRPYRYQHAPYRCQHAPYRCQHAPYLIKCIGSFQNYLGSTCTT